MRVLTAHRSILPTRNVAWQHVPSVPPAPLQQLPPIAKEGESTAGKGASGKGTPSQGEGGVEYLYSEFDLNMTEVWPPVPPTTLKEPAEEHGAEAGGGAEGNPPTSSVSPGRVNFGGINGSSSSSGGDSCTSSDTSNSNDSGDLPAICGEIFAGLGGFWRAPRTAKLTHEVPFAGLGHELVLRGCLAGVCREDRGSQQDRGGGGRGIRPSPRFTAGRAPEQGA